MRKEKARLKKNQNPERKIALNCWGLSQRRENWFSGEKMKGKEMENQSK